MPGSDRSVEPQYTLVIGKRSETSLAAIVLTPGLPDAFSALSAAARGMVGIDGVVGMAFRAMRLLAMLNGTPVPGAVLISKMLLALRLIRRLTCFANPLASRWILIRISRIVGMAIQAMRLASVYARRTLAPAQVFCLSDRFQMERVDALSVPAQMIELEPFADLAVGERPGNPMGGPVAAPEPELPVAIVHETAQPIPAVVGPFPLNFLPKAVKITNVAHENPPSCMFAMSEAISYGRQ